MYACRTDRPCWALARVLCVLVACSMGADPAGAADDPTLDGRVGVGGLALGSLPSGAADGRISTDLRLEAANLGRKPIGLRLDGDFYFDTDDVVLRTYRVLDMNVWLRPNRGPVTLTIGRQRVADTTEELVDGVGARFDLGHGFALGGYGGLIPDPFSTLLSVQTGGGGLVFGYSSYRFRAELIGGLSGRSSGPDHSFVSLSVLGTPARAFSLYGRAKMNGLITNPALANVFTGITVRPAKVLRIGAMYSAYSSEAYADLLDRDPTLSRFAARAESLDLLEELPNDELDPTLYHQMGGNVDLRSGEKHIALGARYRQRFVSEADDRYVLAELHGGPAELGKGPTDVRLAGRYILASDRPIGQAEIGVETTLFKRRLDLGSYVMFSGSPAAEGEDRRTVGVYGDLFLAFWLGKGWSLMSAVRVGWEDTPAASEVTVDGLLKINYRFHREWAQEAQVQ